MAQQNQRERQQQRQRMVIILILVLLIGAGAYLFLGLRGDKETSGGNARPSGQVAIPVATRNINLGERIAGNMFKVSYKTPDKVPTDALLKVDQFLGRFATAPILQESYFTAANVSEADVAGGYSAIAKPGKRVVVLNSNILPGAIPTLRIGDRIDLLAIGTPGGMVTAPTAPAAKTAADSAVTMEGGGSQPGDPNSGARKRARARAAGEASVSATAATLVAENAEVLRVPTRGKDTEVVVLQMTPQDAHVTTLMAASGAVMRVVFRPFHDETRITKESEVQITTRIPKPEPDPDAVTIITGTVRQNTRPQSQAFEVAETNRSNDEDAYEPRNDVYSDTASSARYRSQPIYQDIKVQMTPPAGATR